jgi:hypothetical protein
MFIKFSLVIDLELGLDYYYPELIIFIKII